MTNKKTDIVTPTVTAALKGTPFDTVTADSISKPGKLIKVEKDIPKILAKKPALISYSKADFISTVAVLCANDADLKVPVACDVAESICQIAGEHYNKLVVAEQEVALKKAIEAESMKRYALVEFVDGDYNVYYTEKSESDYNDDALWYSSRVAAKLSRPFMEIRNVFMKHPNLNDKDRADALNVDELGDL